MDGAFLDETSWEIWNAAGEVIAAGGASSGLVGDCGLGCTDPTACNYDVEAVQDDGLCDYNAMDAPILQRNYDETATIDDASCLVNDECGVCGGDNTSCTGCTDSTACNYDEAATIDDGLAL